MKPKTISLEMDDQGRFKLPWPEWEGIMLSREGLHTHRGLLKPDGIDLLFWKAAKGVDRGGLATWNEPASPPEEITPSQTERKPLYHHRQIPDDEKGNQITAFLDTTQWAYCTREHYRRELLYLYDFCERENLERWNDLDKAGLEKYITQSRRKGISAPTLTKQLSPIRSFFRYLIDTERATHNPAAGLRVKQ